MWGSNGGDGGSMAWMAHNAQQPQPQQHVVATAGGSHPSLSSFSQSHFSFQGSGPPQPPQQQQLLLQQPMMMMMMPAEAAAYSQPQPHMAGAAGTGGGGAMVVCVVDENGNVLAVQQLSQLQLQNPNTIAAYGGGGPSWNQQQQQAPSVASRAPPTSTVSGSLSSMMTTLPSHHPPRVGGNATTGQQPQGGGIPQPRFTFPQGGGQAVSMLPFQLQQAMSFPGVDPTTLRQQATSGGSYHHHHIGGGGLMLDVPGGGTMMSSFNNSANGGGGGGQAAAQFFGASSIASSPATSSTNLLRHTAPSASQPSPPAFSVFSPSILGSNHGGSSASSPSVGVPAVGFRLASSQPPQQAMMMMPSHPVSFPRGGSGSLTNCLPAPSHHHHHNTSTSGAGSAAFTMTNHQQHSVGSVSPGGAVPNLYVASLPNDFSTEQLVSLFSQFGEIASARLMVSREVPLLPNRSFGFVLFKTLEAAMMAVTKGNGMAVGGSSIQVYTARSHPTTAANGPSAHHLHQQAILGDSNLNAAGGGTVGVSSSSSSAPTTDGGNDTSVPPLLHVSHPSTATSDIMVPVASSATFSADDLSASSKPQFVASAASSAKQTTAHKPTVYTATEGFHAPAPHSASSGGSRGASAPGSPAATPPGTSLPLSLHMGMAPPPSPPPGYLVITPMQLQALIAAQQPPPQSPPVMGGGAATTPSTHKEQVGRSESMAAPPSTHHHRHHAAAPGMGQHHATSATGGIISAAPVVGSFSSVSPLPLSLQPNHSGLGTPSDAPFGAVGPCTAASFNEGHHRASSSPQRMEPSPLTNDLHFGPFVGDGLTQVERGALGYVSDPFTL